MTSEQRNRIGFISVLLLATLINILAYAVVYIREFIQSKKGGFPIEKDDLYHYGVATILGSMINIFIASIVLFIVTL